MPDGRKPEPGDWNRQPHRTLRTRAGMMKRSREAEKRRARVVEICGSLPEVEISGKQHLAFRVRKRTFAYYQYDHHGDGRIALCCKASPGEQRKLVERNPAGFFVPPYLGPKGWVALRLDLREVDWGKVIDLVLTAYRLIAPRTLVALVFRGAHERVNERQAVGATLKTQ